MITICHLNNSRSERVIWLMEELGLPYRLENFQREASGMAPAALRAIHPLGKSPIIRDGDSVIAESGAILEYIINRYGEGRLAVPPASPDYARYLEWLHAAEGTAMLQFLAHWRMVRLGLEEAPMAAWTRKNSEDLLNFMATEIGARPYWAGEEFTAADIMMVFVLRFLRVWAKFDLSPYPALAAYLERIESRPAFQRAMTIANPASPDAD
jgi:glutathione S-transferase